MKATLIFNGELAAGIRATSYDLTIEGLNIADVVHDDAERRGVKNNIANFFNELYGETPDDVLLEDECLDCRTPMTQLVCNNPNCIANIVFAECLDN